MARNNHVYVKGDITGDIYYDVFKLDGKDWVGRLDSLRYSQRLKSDEERISR